MIMVCKVRASREAPGAWSVKGVGAPRKMLPECPSLYILEFFLGVHWPMLIDFRMSKLPLSFHAPVELKVLRRPSKHV